MSDRNFVLPETEITSEAEFNSVMDRWLERFDREHEAFIARNDAFRAKLGLPPWIEESAGITSAAV